MVAIILLLSSCGTGPQPRLKPFAVDWRDNEGSPVDMSFLLDAPAGKDGFITAGDGHLVKPNGERLRIWGVNCSMQGNTPDKELAPVYAGHLARFGINCVRVHHFDWPAPRGVIDATSPDSRHFDADKLDRFDFFVAELKKRGIYVNLNLNVGRQFKEGDGVKDADKLGFAKALTYFDPRLIDLQKEYARMLLTHRNPYTGAEYRHEPAIVIVEMVNENSIVESWMRGRLLGNQVRPTRTTWTDIPPSYEKDLTNLYNGWLKREVWPRTLAQIRREARVGPNDPIPRLKPDEYAEASGDRFQTEARFYMELEDNFFQSMRRYLKDELGVKSLLVATSVHSRLLSGYPLLNSTSKLDIVDGHTYWQHPSYRRDPVTGERLSWTIRNSPMVNEPFHSSVDVLARNAFAGQPYTVSEVNHPWPSEYAAEGIPILAAYGAFHDWDGIFWYSFAHQEPAEWAPGYPGFFDIRQDPVKMAQLAAGALIFARGDVAAAGETVERSYSKEQVIETLRMPSSEAPYFTPGFPPALGLQHGTRVASLDSRPSDAFTVSADSPLSSDTGELAWYYSPEGNGLVTVDTDRSQALIGFVKANQRELTHLAAGVMNDFCAITLGSLDGEPIATSARMLLTTGSRVATTGMKWNEDRTTLLEEGGAPILIETVVGTVTLKGMEGATAVEAVPLDGAGKPAGGPAEATQSGDDWTIAIGKIATPWYLVRVTR